MENEMISVVVPIYNVEKYLDRCIKSIVDQTYRNLEIILVDDGSPDRCPQICEEWARRDSRIRVIHKENAGLGMARNTGIEHATGTYICYFDSDDYVDVHTIELAYGAIQNNHADMAVFGHYDTFPDGKNVGHCKERSKTVYKGAEITKSLLPWLIYPDRRREPEFQFPFSAWSGLVRRSILEENNIRFQSERKIISEDTLYLLELYSKVQTVVLIPKPLYFYCLNPTSLTKTYRKDRQEKNNVFLRTAMDVIDALGFDEEVQIRIAMLYQAFSLEAMKHILRIPASRKEKKAMLFSLLSDEVLQKSYTWRIISRSGFAMAVFMVCAKCNLWHACYVLLWMKERIAQKR